MKTSDSVVNIAPAFLAAQIEIKHASKNQQGQFNSKYANLESVIDAIKECLNKNGIMILQTMSADNILTTTLLHNSGEWFKSEMKMMLDKQSVQGMGSSISYFRRYSLAAMCNIAQVDDDGARSTKEAEDSNNKYTFKAGIHKGKCLHDWTLDQILAYLDSITAIKKKTPEVLEIIKMVNEYLKEYGP